MSLPFVPPSAPRHCGSLFVYPITSAWPKPQNQAGPRAQHQGMENRHQDRPKMPFVSKENLLLFFKVSIPCSASANPFESRIRSNWCFVVEALTISMKTNLGVAHIFWRLFRFFFLPFSPRCISHSDLKFIPFPPPIFFNATHPSSYPTNGVLVLLSGWKMGLLRWQNSANHRVGTVERCSICRHPRQPLQQRCRARLPGRAAANIWERHARAAEASRKRFQVEGLESLEKQWQ